MMDLRMSVRLAFASLLLTACSFSGTDEGGHDQEPFYEDAAGIRLEPQGTLTLTQTLHAAADQCPPLVPRETLTFIIAEDGTVTSPDPFVILEGMGHTAWEHAPVFVTIEDEWDSVAVTVDYDLSIIVTNEVDGYGGITAPGCDAEVRVVGSRAP
jgi:hypothetical protein